MIDPAGPPPDDLLSVVSREVARYSHPLFRFNPRAAPGAVLLSIELREGLGVCYQYEARLEEREILSPQFPWTFQKVLYDSLNDMMVEMFERNPQKVSPAP
jgi:hypothetical protein